MLHLKYLQYKSVTKHIYLGIGNAFVTLYSGLVTNSLSFFQKSYVKHFCWPI